MTWESDSELPVRRVDHAVLQRMCPGPLEAHSLVAGAASQKRAQFRLDCSHSRLLGSPQDDVRLRSAGLTLPRKKRSSKGSQARPRLQRPAPVRGATLSAFASPLL